MLKSLGIAIMLFAGLSFIAGITTFQRNFRLIWWIIILAFGGSYAIFGESEAWYFMATIVCIGIAIWTNIKLYQTNREGFKKTFWIVLIVSLLSAFLLPWA